MKNKVIKDLSDKDLIKIARIHKNSYHSNHFTSKFSDKKLKEYYKELIKFSDLTILTFDEKINECMGFIISGTEISKGITKFIKKNKKYLLFLMLKNPQFLYEKLYYKIYTKICPLAQKKIETKTKSTRLLSISVDSKIQSKGIGKSLLVFFEKELQKRKIFEYGLSVRESNKGALKFYLNNGFKEEKRYMKSIYLIKKIGVENE